MQGCPVEGGHKPSVYKSAVSVKCSKMTYVYIRQWGSLTFTSLLRLPTYIPKGAPQDWQRARAWKQPRCPLTDEWIKKMWHIYTMKYHSAIEKNEFETVLLRWMNLENGIDEHICKEGMRCRYKEWICGHVGEGESGTSGESSINIYTPLGLRWVTSEKLPCSPGSPAWWWPGRMGSGEGREAQEGGDACTDLHYYTAKANTTL